MKHEFILLNPPEDRTRTTYEAVGRFEADCLEEAIKHFADEYLPCPEGVIVQVVCKAQQSVSYVPIQAPADAPISILELDKRALNRLDTLEIRTVGQLCNWREEDLMRCPNLGRKSLNVIKTALHRRKLKLRA